MFRDTVQGLKRMVGSSTSEEGVPSLVSLDTGVIGGFHRLFAFGLRSRHVDSAEVVWLVWFGGACVAFWGQFFDFVIVSFCFFFCFFPVYR